MDILICNSVYDYICVGLCYKELNMFVDYVYMFIVVLGCGNFMWIKV